MTGLLKFWFQQPAEPAVTSTFFPSRCWNFGADSLSIKRQKFITRCYNSKAFWQHNNNDWEDGSLLLIESMGMWECRWVFGRHLLLNADSTSTLSDTWYFCKKCVDTTILATGKIWSLLLFWISKWFQYSTKFSVTPMIFQDFGGAHDMWLPNWMKWYSILMGHPNIL